MTMHGQNYIKLTMLFSNNTSQRK